MTLALSVLLVSFFVGSIIAIETVSYFARKRFLCQIEVERQNKKGGTADV